MMIRKVGGKKTVLIKNSGYIKSVVIVLIKSATGSCYINLLLC